MQKCEFCDITFQSELDVSKHLVDESHRDKVVKAISLHPLEKSNLKDTPNTIVKVFESLKLRTNKDVRDLADKGYFKLVHSENTANLLSVADRLVHVFLKCIADEKTKKLTPESRKIIMDSFDKKEVKEEPKSTTSTGQSSAQSEQRRPNETGSTARQQSTAGTSSVQLETRSPPPKRRTLVEPRPAPAYTPNPTPPTQVRQPTRVGLQATTSANSTSSNQAASSRSTTSTDRRGNPPTTVRAPATTASNPRVPVQGSHQRDKLRPAPDPTNTSAQETSGSAQNRGFETRPIATPRPRPRPPIARPPAPGPVAPHNLGQSQSRPAATRPSAPRPTIDQNLRNLRPPGSMPPPSQMPMTGASFMPRRPIDDDKPQPRKDSTYQPKLAKIKIEPKDDP